MRPGCESFKFAWRYEGKCKMFELIYKPLNIKLYSGSIYQLKKDMPIAIKKREVR